MVYDKITFQINFHVPWHVKSSGTTSKFHLTNNCTNSTCLARNNRPLCHPVVRRNDPSVCGRAKIAALRDRRFHNREIVCSLRVLIPAKIIMAATSACNLDLKRSSFNLNKKNHMWYLKFTTRRRIRYHSSSTGRDWLSTCTDSAYSLVIQSVHSSFNQPTPHRYLLISINKWPSGR